MITLLLSGIGTVGGLKRTYTLRAQAVLAAQAVLMESYGARCK